MVAKVVVTAAPDETTDVLGAEGSVTVFVDGPTVNVLPETLNEGTSVTVFPPLTLKLFPETDNVGCGTLMLNEFAANVVVTAAPDETTDVFGADGNVTVFPPLTLKLFPDTDKIGCGTLMLKEFAANVVVTAAPDETTDVFGAEGKVTVFPPLTLKLFPDTDNVG